ncbi:hypothetical protein TrST_g11682 [Triparma strigata]|uniref:Ankyrin repeat protein n=1 Tax=Triparma strigata TaxID=1606541 RepID=A0A9W7B8E1_9STRA|nr:hypothetical protein TrST_g11682 [Triparma strigata]
MAFFIEKKDSSAIPEHMLEENQLPNENNLALFTAALDGDFERVKSAVKAGAKPNYFHRPADGATSMHAASRSSTIEASQIMNYLFVHGGCLDAKMITNHNTPLHEAIMHSNKSTVEALLDAGAAFVPNSFGNTPLHLAVQQGNIQIALLLLAKKHPVDCKNNRGMTALHICCNLCEEKVMTPGAGGVAAPVAAAMNPESYLKLAGGLILYGCPLDEVDANRYTALHAAASRGNLDMVQLLVDSGCDITIKSFMQLTETKVVERTAQQVATLNSHVSVEAYLEGCEKKRQFGSLIPTNVHVSKWTKGVITAAKIKSGQKENEKTVNVAVGSAANVVKTRAKV